MTKEKIILGIDLGTTYSSVAYVDETGYPKILENDEGQRSTPSVVYFEDSGNVIVGRVAKSSLALDPMKGVELAKREIANLSSSREKRNWEIYGKKYTPEDVSSFILKKLVKDACAKLGKEVNDVIITVPAYFDLTAREAVRTAGILAGLNVLALLNEPEAAAIAFTYGKVRKPETIFIYDLGGGTFDVTLLKYDGKKCEVLATDGDHALGGADFDRRLLEHLAKQAMEEGVDVYSNLEKLQELKENIEITKIALSTAEKKKVRVDQKQYEVTREKYTELIQDKLAETEITMNNLLQAAKDKGIEGWQNIDRIILVGGSSRTPAVRSLVARVTGKEPDITMNPDEAVALGAAIYGNIYKEIEEKLEEEQKQGIVKPEEVEEKKIFYLEGKVSSVCSHSIGIVALTESGKRRNAILVKKNTKIPCEAEHVFGTRAAHQETACIRILLGESENIDECREVGKVTLRLTQDLPKESPIRVHLKYNFEGRLDVFSESLANGDKIESTLDLRDQLTPEEIQIQREQLEQIEVQ